MDYVRIGKLDENDFDAIFSKIGGRRYSDDHSRELDKNADFLLGNAIVELKLVEEEGLEKPQRQQKLADIFRTRQPNRPVIVMRPDQLDEDGQRDYYAAMVGPIKTHITKANKQLRQSAEQVGGDRVRVLLLVNNGYASLSHREFKDLAIRRACNDTSSIDAIIIAGHYYFSDTFDAYFFPEIDLFPIRLDRPFADYDRLRDEWHRFSENHLTQGYILGTDSHAEKRLPVQELTFTLDGVTYVKPAPPMGKPSEFFVHGRPRINSSGISKCPAVAKTFPNLDRENWERFKDKFSSADFFKNSYSEWVRFQQLQDNATGMAMQPFVPVSVEFDPFLMWCDENKRFADVPALCEFAADTFNKKACQIRDHAQEQTESSLSIPRYVLLVTEVIGRDMANDLSSIFLVWDDLAGERVVSVVENQRMFFEHAVAVAAAYAIKHGLEIVRYQKDMTNAWV